MGDELPVLAFASAEDWRAWLDEHHDTSPGLWLRIARKGTGVSSVTYSEALDVALCYGWIDGQKKKYDDTTWVQRFTPRGPRSRWSRINRDRAQALIDAGRMCPAGQREVDRARADGRWESAYAGQRTATVPDDLAAALADNPAAAEFFATLDSANRYSVLYRVQDAKRPETRARRIATFVAMLARGEKLHP